MRESLQAGWAEASALFMTFVPRLLLAAVILGVGYIVAKAVCKLLSRGLDRVGFNRLVERGGVKRTLEHSGWDASMILSKIVFYFVMLFVLQLAFGVFGPNPISTILTGIIAFLPNVFVAVVIVTLAAAFATAAKQLIQVALGSLAYGRLIANCAAAAIVIVGVTAALNQLHIAPAIVNGLFYAMLAIIVGVSVVAIGGGGIQPMRARWERALNRIDEEAPKVKEASQGASERIQAVAGNWQSKAASASQSSSAPAAGADPAGQSDRFTERRSPPSRRIRGPGEDI